METNNENIQRGNTFVTMGIVFAATGITLSLTTTPFLLFMSLVGFITMGYGFWMIHKEKAAVKERID